jgi:hypothetical protein
MADDPDSPGRAAIDAALDPLHEGQEPLHFGTADGDVAEGIG